MEGVCASSQFPEESATVAACIDMNSDFEKVIEEESLRPIKVPGKESYFSDIREIAGSLAFFIGKKYAIAYELVRETEKMLINAVALFEKGYFDAAFYMLRQTLEICMTIAYFLELPDDEREKKFRDWKSSIADFPGTGSMRRILEKAEFSIDFKDFMSKMPSFFDEFKQTYSRLNKYTHKQGFRYFYTIRCRRVDGAEMDKILLANFTDNLERCIGCALMFRLMIDPLPILRLDEEIEYRIADPIMFPLSPRVVQKYIGEQRLEEYRPTNLCCGFRKSILDNYERMTEATYTYVNMDHIDRKDIPKVLKQAHLLTLRQRVQLSLIAGFPQIAAIVSYDGLWHCFTDVKSNRTDVSESSEEYRQLRESGNWANQKFKGVFATVVRIKDDYYTLEHNEPLDPMTVIELGKFAQGLIDQIEAQESEAKKLYA